MPTIDVTILFSSIATLRINCITSMQTNFFLSFFSFKFSYVLHCFRLLIFLQFYFPFFEKKITNVFQNESAFLGFIISHSEYAMFCILHNFENIILHCLPHFAYICFYACWFLFHSRIWMIIFFSDFFFIWIEILRFCFPSCILDPKQNIEQIKFLRAKKCCCNLYCWV